MNIFVGNTSKYFFPLFTLNSAYYADIFALLFTIVHILLTFLCTLLTIQVCVIMKRVHVFHPNMTTIVVAILGQWFEVLIAKIILFPYQLGFVTVGEPRSYQLWVTNTPSDMPQAQKTSDIAPLFVSGIMYLHYAFTIVFSVFILTCERACATFFIRDYEKKPRSYICICLLLMAHSLTLLLSCLATFEIISFTTGTAISGIAIVGACMIYFIILHINIRIQRRIDRNENNYYSLAIRFQAKENAKALELAKKVVVFATGAILFGITLLVVAALHCLDDHIATVVTLADAVFNLNPLFIVPVGLYSVPLWRDRFLKSTPILVRLLTFSARKKQKVSAANTKDNEEAKQTDIYFNQLSEAWK